MSSSGRRGPELKKKLQRRNNSLRPADFTKEHNISASNEGEGEKDCVKKTKESLTELRKRIEERKKSSKLKDIQQYIHEYKPSVPLSTSAQPKERKYQQERREDTVPQLAETADDDTPITERDSREEPNEEDPFKEETLAQTIARTAQKRNINQAPKTRGYHPVKVNSNESQQNVHSCKNNSHNSNHQRHEKDGAKNIYGTPTPTHIEVHSKETFDDGSTEVSEITTDVRILCTKGASYAERRMNGRIQRRLARPHLSGPPGHRLEKDVEINVSDLNNLSKTVEKAKIYLQQEMSPAAIIPRHGLPYEETDYREELDDDDEEGEDSWGGTIANQPGNTVCIQGPPSPKNEANKQLTTTNKASTRKLQSLVKEAYSYEGDVFIDATEIRDEDLDGGVPVLTEDGDCCNPIQVDDDSIDLSELLGDENVVEEDVDAQQRPTTKPTDDCIDKIILHRTLMNENSESQASKPAPLRKTLVQVPSTAPDKNRNIVLPVNITDDPNLKKESNNISPIPVISTIPSSDNDVHSVNKNENYGRDDPSPNISENDPSTNNNPTSLASEFYQSSRGFFKSFTDQVDTQLKNFKQGGLIPESDMNGMLGVLDHDIDETEKKLPKDSDDAVILLGDEFERSACGIESHQLGKDIESDADPVEQMLESLRKTYKSGISNCGVDSGMIKENTKAIEEMVAGLKAKNRNKNTSKATSSQQPQIEYSTDEKTEKHQFTIPVKAYCKASEPQSFIVPVNRHSKE
ncbi:MAG: hypothetical protein ACI8RD_001092 [Bacillariaceae sp.]|jgi:hypothetical protein